MASHRVSIDTVGGVASLPWVMVKVLFCTRPSLTLPQWGGEGACWFGEEGPVLHVVSGDTARECHFTVILLVSRDESPSFLFDTSLVMVVKHLITAF